MAPPVITDIDFDAPAIVRGAGPVRATVISSDPDAGILTVTATLTDAGGNTSAEFNKSIPVQDPPASGTMVPDDPTVSVVPISPTEYDLSG